MPDMQNMQVNEVSNLSQKNISYFVAPDKKVYAEKRGVLSNGEQVTPEDFPSRQLVINHHLRNKNIIAVEG